MVSEKVNSGVLDIHVEKLKNSLAKRIKDSEKLTEEQKSIFTDDRLVHLLKDEPMPLYDLHLEIMKELIPGYDDNEFENLKMANHKKEDNRTDAENQLVENILF